MSAKALPWIINLLKNQEPENCKSVTASALKQAAYKKNTNR